MMPRYQPLSELLRPQQLDDLTLSQVFIDRMQRMIDDQRIMNMLLHGKPGIGKTSAARIFAKAAGEDAYEIAGSSLIKADSLRPTVERYAVSVSFSGLRKICVIDEADSMSASADGALRPLIERVARNCAFILTANRLEKLSPGLRSRLIPVCFDIAGTERQAVIARWMPKLEAKLNALGIKYHQKRLGEIVGVFFPELRRIAEQIELEFW